MNDKPNSRPSLLIPAVLAAAMLSLLAGCGVVMSPTPSQNLDKAVIADKILITDAQDANLPPTQAWWIQFAVANYVQLREIQDYRDGKAVESDPNAYFSRVATEVLKK